MPVVLRITKRQASKTAAWISFLPHRPTRTKRTMGGSNQIGYGQTYLQYLADMHDIFRGCQRVAKNTATMWLVLDTFRKEGQLRLLPFELADRAQDAGWQLQEVIIWDKHRTLPWSHHGQMRNVFEYILTFSRGPQFKYYLDRIRESADLKEWWVNYPERYHPTGKAPQNIWSFDIPVQGSWGNGVVRHANPFPLDLVERILRLTTDESDLVLDPFAGVGSVLAQATVMGRRAIGFELNADHAEQYERLLTHARQRWAHRQTPVDYSSVIPRLRMLKYAKQLHHRAKDAWRSKGTVDAIVVLRRLLRDDERTTNTHWGMRTVFITSDELSGRDRKAFAKAASEIGSKRPLSKYGLAVEIQFKGPAELSIAHPLWRYDEGQFRSSSRSYDLVGDLVRLTDEGWKKHPPIFADFPIEIPD